MEELFLSYFPCLVLFVVLGLPRQPVCGNSSEEIVFCHNNSFCCCHSDFGEGTCSSVLRVLPEVLWGLATIIEASKCHAQNRDEKNIFGFPCNGPSFWLGLDSTPDEYSTILILPCHYGSASQAERPVLGQKE